MGSEGMVLWEGGGFVLAVASPALREELVLSGARVKDFRPIPRVDPPVEEPDGSRIYFSPMVDAMVREVSAGNFIYRLGELSGALGTVIEGEPETLRTRYTYGPQAQTAEGVGFDPQRSTPSQMRSSERLVE